MAMGGACAQSAPGEIVGHQIPVPGEPVSGTTSALSEVERDIVDSLPAQKQAEQLMQYAISHHRGATKLIKARVEQWRGKIEYNKSLETLFDVALNGDDLRVRGAALEVMLAAYNVAKTPEAAEEMIRRVKADRKNAAVYIYILGVLANRGVEAEIIHGELRVWADDEGVQTRVNAVSAIAMIGTDDTVPDLLEAFHHDHSSLVRIQGGGCGLAHCGMLTRAQRMQAVPGLIQMVEDPKLDESTVKYGYRALREITDQTMGDNAGQWQEWYDAHGGETTEKFRRFENEHDRDE